MFPLLLNESIILAKVSSGLSHLQQFSKINKVFWNPEGPPKYTDIYKVDKFICYQYLQ